MKKLSNSEAELKKALLIKRKRLYVETPENGWVSLKL